MKEYLLTPKKARGRSCKAWWYANARGIEVYFQHADSPVGGSAVITRAQLLKFIAETEPKPRKRRTPPRTL